MSATGASGLEEATVSGVNCKPKEKDGFDKRYNKMCEAIKTLAKNIAAKSAGANPAMSVPQQARSPPTSYRCGVVGHLSNYCKRNMGKKKPSAGENKTTFKCCKCGGYGHIAKNCVDLKN